MSRDLLLVAIALFTWGIGESAYFFFQPLYLEQLGASPMVIGAILGGVGIAMTVSHMPAGYLADRYGRRKMMITAWVLGLISGGIMAFAKSLNLFSMGVLLYGVTAFVVSPMNSYVTAARGNWSVGRAITFTSAAYNAGAIIGPLVGGQIGNRFGLSKIYLFATFVFFISTLIIIFIRPQPVKFQRTSIFSKKTLNRSYLGFLPILFFAIFAMYLPQPLAPNFLQNFHGLSVSEIGSLGSLGSLGTVLLSLGFGYLSPKFGFILGQGIAGLFVLFLWRGTGLAWFAVGYIFSGGLKVARTMAIARISALVAPENIGLAYGIAESVGGVAMILAPPLAGFLYEQNPLLVFQVALGLLILSLILSSILPKETHPILKPGEEYG